MLKFRAYVFFILFFIGVTAAYCRTVQVEKYGGNPASSGYLFMLCFVPGLIIAYWPQIELWFRIRLYWLRKKKTNHTDIIRIAGHWYTTIPPQNRINRQSNKGGKYDEIN